jgi:hypothetical protein
MSDSFGATDLDADMPGLGPQTGNVRGPPQGLPSQLQALVQHFTQQSQGKPNPKFLPPPPGQGGGPKKPPKLGSTDPPDPGARAMAPLPANAPQPPAAFTPYMRPVPRDDTQWNQPEPFPRLPNSFELAPMYQNLGGYFAQHGSYQSTPVANGLAGASKEYIDGYAKGQEIRMREAQEQVRLHAAQLEDLERTRSILYADVLARHRAEGDNNQTSIHDDFWKIAVEHGDQDVQRMIENGDSAEQVRRYLAEHEANIRALSAANKKSDEQEAVEAQAGLAPAREEGGTGGGVYDRYAPGATGGGAAPAGGQVAGPGAPSGDKDTRAKGVGDPLEPDKDEPADTRSAGDKLIDGGAWDMVEGFKPTGGDYSKPTTTKMAIRKIQMEDALRDIANNPNLNRDGQHPEEVLNAVRKAVPEAADKLDQYSHYRDGPGIGGRSSSGGPEAGMWGLFNPLATKMYPGDKGTGEGAFSGDNFTKRIRFADNTQYQTTLRRVATSSEGGSQVIAAANGLPPEASNPNVFKRAMKQAFDEGTGDERYVALANAVKRYQSEMNVVIRGGVGGQGETMENLRTVNPIFATPTNYRIIVAQDAQLAQASVNSFKHQYKQMGGGPMPGLDPDAEGQLHDLANMDPVHQAQPGQVVPGKEWSDGKARVWLGPFDNRGRLRQNPDDNWDMAK